MYEQDKETKRYFEFVAEKLPPWNKNITIVASPCYGSVKLIVTPPVANDSDIPEDDSWKKSAGFADNVITVPSRFLALKIKVFAYNDSTYTLGVYYVNPPQLDLIDYMDAVSPEIDDIILKGDPMTMNVTFNTSDVAKATYDVYKIQRSKNPESVCNIINGAEEDCVVKTECGLQNLVGKKVATLSKSIENPPAESKQSVLVGDLVQNVNYTFNVVLTMNDSGLSLAYRGTQGTPEFEYTATNVSKGTTIAIIVVIIVVVILLIMLMIFMKMRLTKRYQHID